LLDEPAFVELEQLVHSWLLELQSCGWHVGAGIVGGLMKTPFLAAIAPLLIAAAPTWQERTLAAAAPFIDKANDEWTRAIVARDFDVLVAPYDLGGIFIGPDGSISVGKAAVRSMYASRPAAVRVLKASIRSDGRVAHDRDDVYEWGSAMMTVRRDSEVKQISGRYLTVWHRSGTRWVITRNIAF
jgi:ketosteroid isomerase-like protein